MISIIITSYKFTQTFKNCITKYKDLNKDLFEIILITESNDKKFYDIVNYLKDFINISIIKTEEKKPGIKRHIAVKSSKYDYLYFIDDDAYPSKNTINIALKLFLDKKIKVFGGPSSIPHDSSFFERAIHVSNSLLILSGNYIFFNKTIDKQVNELPSVNFFIKKDTYNSTRGFNNGYWPGEDTFLCNEILNKDIKIYYFGELNVFHYSRSNIKKFIKQIFNYSKTRGYFFKLGIKNSQNFKFFIPSIFCIYLIFIILNLIFNFMPKFVFVPLMVYSFICLFNFIKLKKFSIQLRISGILINIITHVVYGLGFVYGTSIKKYDISFGR